MRVSSLVMNGLFHGAWIVLANQNELSRKTLGITCLNFLSHYKLNKSIMMLKHYFVASFSRFFYAGFLFLLLVLNSTSNAFAATAVLLESDVGDYIGQGRTQTYATVTVNGDQTSVNIDFSPYHATFAAPRGGTLATNTEFPGATRYPFQSPTNAGLSVSGDGRGCNRLTGWFEVREALFSSNGAPARLAIDFKQNCERSSAALYGAIRFNSDVPLETPSLRAIVGRDQSAYGQEIVVMDASQSIVRTGGASTFQWIQRKGPAVELRGGNTHLADFTAPYAAPGGEDLIFELRVSDGAKSDSAVLTIHTRSKTDPQTHMLFKSDPGDYIGGGRTFRYLENDGDFLLGVNSRGGASLSFNGEDYWNADFGPPQGTPFTIGHYENAQRFPFADADRPGLAISGAGRGCNTLSGKFDVLQLVPDSTGGFSRVAIDYEQHCGGQAPALYGEVRVNYLAPNPPTAVAGPDQSVGPNVNVVLNGRGSSDDAGIKTYRWRQIGGLSVPLTGADTATASFVSPMNTGDLEFSLLVVDDDELTSADSVTISVGQSQRGTAEAANSLDSGRGTLSPFWLLLCFLLRSNRKR